MNSFGFRTFPKKGLPSGEQLKELVSTDVILFNDALKSGDFSKFREALTKSMKEGSTPETLKQNFSALNNNKKYAQNVAADKIYFEDYPDLIGSEYLIVKVRYPLDGNQAGFVAMSFSFKKEEGKWKIGDVRAGVQTGG
jgi:hypothetical protein